VEGGANVLGYPEAVVGARCQSPAGQGEADGVGAVESGPVEVGDALHGGNERRLGRTGSGRFQALYESDDCQVALVLGEGGGAGDSGVGGEALWNSLVAGVFISTGSWEVEKYTP
jgi:hypothetical protein